MRLKIGLVWVCVIVGLALVAFPAFAQDVSPNESVSVPGWVWVIAGSTIVLVGFGIVLGVFKGDITRAKEDIAKLDAKLDALEKATALSFITHEREDRERFATAEAVQKLEAAKASREYVDGIRQGFESKVDLLINQVSQMKNDMDRQFMFLRSELRGENTGSTRVSASDDTNPGPGNTPPSTGRRR